MTSTELSQILADITLQLGDIMSFGLGGLTAIAFVIASHIKWD